MILRRNTIFFTCIPVISTFTSCLLHSRYQLRGSGIVKKEKENNIEDFKTQICKNTKNPENVNLPVMTIKKLAVMANR